MAKKKASSDTPRSAAIKAFSHLGSAVLENFSFRISLQDDHTVYTINTKGLRYTKVIVYDNGKICYYSGKELRKDAIVQSMWSIVHEFTYE